MSEPQRLAAMVEQVDASPAIFRPSAFWKASQKRNLGQLTTSRLENFKRTINQNYFNWVPTTVEDNQFRALLRLTSEHPSLDAFQAELDEIDLFEDFSLQNSLRRKEIRRIYCMFVGMLWQYTKLSYPNGLIEAICEPSLGNPLPIRLGERLISQDLANSIRERNIIAWPWEASFAERKTVSFVEIGAGYGRLAYVFLKSAPVCYTVVDIPPALYVAQWYLSCLFPEKRIFAFRRWDNYDRIKDELIGSDLSFMTPDQFALLPNGFFDAGTTISSLSEMTAEQAQMYLELLGDKVRQFIYIKQWVKSVNELDGHFFSRSHFDLPPPWIKYIDRLDAVQGDFFETLWSKS